VLAVLPPHFAGTVRYRRHYPPMPCTLLCSLPWASSPVCPREIHRAPHRCSSLFVEVLCGLAVQHLILPRPSLFLLSTLPSSLPSFCPLPLTPFLQDWSPFLPLCLPRPSCRSRPANELGSAALIQLPGLARIPRPPPLGHWQLSPTGQASPLSRASRIQLRLIVQSSAVQSAVVQPSRQGGEKGTQRYWHGRRVIDPRSAKASYLLGDATAFVDVSRMIGATRHG